jgi:transcriptional regulator with XRE-family HTH domain
MLVFTFAPGIDCEHMLDLAALGQELRSRRRALRIPSAELARRIGVSPTYIWLIEQAKPRQGGEPSRPSEDLLQRWTAALGMSRSDVQRIRELAGYLGSRFTSERDSNSPSIARTSMRSASTADRTPAPEDVENDFRQTSQGRNYSNAANMAALHQWAGTERAIDEDETFVGQVRDVLQRAEQNGRSEEVRVLLNSFLSWLEFHAARNT